LQNGEFGIIAFNVYFKKFTHNKPTFVLIYIV
jgi:hypothetical protein